MRLCFGLHPSKGFSQPGAEAAALASIPASRSLCSPASSCSPRWGSPHLHPTSLSPGGIAPPSLPKPCSLVPERRTGQDSAHHTRTEISSSLSIKQTPSLTPGARARRASLALAADPGLDAAPKPAVGSCRGSARSGNDGHGVPQPFHPWESVRRAGCFPKGGENPAQTGNFPLQTNSAVCSRSPGPGSGPCPVPWPELTFPNTPGPAAALQRE